MVMIIITLFSSLWDHTYNRQIFYTFTDNFICDSFFLSSEKTWFTFYWIIALWIILWFMLHSKKATLWILHKWHVFLFNYLKIYITAGVSDSCMRMCIFNNFLAGFGRHCCSFSLFVYHVQKAGSTFKHFYYGLMGESLVDEFNTPKC